MDIPGSSTSHTYRLKINLVSSTILRRQSTCNDWHRRFQCSYYCTAWTGGLLCAITVTPVSTSHFMGFVIDKEYEFHQIWLNATSTLSYSYLHMNNVNFLNVCELFTWLLNWLQMGKYRHISMWEVRFYICISSLVSFNRFIWGRYSPYPYAAQHCCGLCGCPSQAIKSWGSSIIVMGRAWLAHVTLATIHVTLIPWWRHTMGIFSALLALCEGKLPMTVGFS